MKLIKAKCNKDKIVEFEDKGTGVGTCPANCPLKKRGSCYSKDFRYRRVLSANVVPDIPYEPDSASQAEAEQREAPAFSVHEPAFSAREEVQEEGYIPYDDPFAEPIAPAAPPNYSEQGGERKRSGADKYNAILPESGLFSKVGAHSPDAPCFVDGVKVFYSDRKRARTAAGDAADAIRYIFLHWYTSKVFQSNGTEFTEEFLYLLKLCNYKQHEGALTDLIGDVSLDVNRKFFRLFYGIVYKNQLGGFYWSEFESPFRELIPKFTCRQDFTGKLLIAGPDFFSGIGGYLPELLAWLQSFRQDAAIDRQWFFEQVPLLIAESAKQIAYVDDADGKLTLVRLGTVQSFISELSVLGSYEATERKYKFLSRFTVLPTGQVIVRKNPLGPEVSEFKEDDSVYELIGIKGASSYCASYYNRYAAILKEYIEVFHPASVRIGGFTFSARDFYARVLGIVEEGYACMLSEEDFGNRRAAYFLVKSLFARGVFSYFESRCETSKLQDLKGLISEKLDPVAYFAFPDMEHKIYRDGRALTITEYFGELTDEKLAGELPKGRSLFRSEEVAQAYFTAKVNANRSSTARKQIDKAVEEAEKIIEKFTN